MAIKSIILAAGKGTRMRSMQPKVLHPLAGKPLVEHVYDLCQELEDNTITIVYGHGGETVRKALDSLSVSWVEQAEQLGTGHAVQQAESQINDNDTVLILYGDVPLLKLATVKVLLADVSDKTLALLTVELDQPKGYGRIVRDNKNQVINITEEKDASEQVKQIREVNTGILAVAGASLKRWLRLLENNNTQNEYYLTDIIALAVSEGVAIKTSQPVHSSEVLGVNNKSQLSYLERVYQAQQAEILMLQGVTLADPNRFDLRGEITKLGQDVSIDVNVILEGTLEIGDGVTIGPNCVIKNSKIANGVEILANCVIENATVGADSRIGPFARLRPAAEIQSSVHIGNFVEVKKSIIGQGSKVNHLSYIGDCQIGESVNVGAGTITCNYDGINKSLTIIEDGAFIGSSTQLVAPVTVGKNSTIAAGSTITKNTPEEQLTLSRAKQITIKGWRRPVKKG
ncbi:MAG: bifunctional UDP-N-acetylglucosamine diphosphorylase/glucosamine-1-phosphate N-acetyltransferase GlmU [Methylococcales bacterium]|mgnify:CR=1 FL=1|jgi:bifunctional UDP-N-acetylglucosamine pyrophosphorylase/glucosamine-1-phosphate N-acetyltransferase|nr:bifunctional UDP-N-acetylglucosamine diphosphorylase/glucosamine-1-phosphate N-acetyltransferase GlmU [Methylococcales bacterium]MBT4663223.1 bifunctional UDP-N-acetylglucosamine diphosphorylase/glucosamine-1-phosphate N-acetyltransferase GlmU [Methylococcales bacterium]MBT5437175.1 bifunctional UDP-N-acetylglucosamine diphosphorylase/glucosamine-1-phosphate N-acetyltransferase GlmU [Methylococcales bacterium]MBT6523835.1 bifunctional UDP-N-acetylglucosamine diphosphorylase/glucosamine-1-phos